MFSRKANLWARLNRLRRSPVFQPVGIAGAVAMASFVSAPAAMANMGTIANTYGLSPKDVASVQAMSLFSRDVSATFYNPANLVKDERGELMLGLLQANGELQASGPDRSGSLVSDTPSASLMLGLKTDLSNLTTSERPLYLGVMLGVENYGFSFLEFSSEASESGQFLEYGRQPLFLSIGGGLQLFRGISGGLSVRATLNNSATLSLTTDLAGNTEREMLQVNAEPSLSYTFSSSIDVGELMCPYYDCNLSGLELAFAYHQRSFSRTTVDASTVIPGIRSESNPLVFGVQTYDSYQPSGISVGSRYQAGPLGFGVTLEYQQWTDLEHEYRSDTIRDQANILFNDIFVPRVAVDMQVSDAVTATAGFAYRPTALRSTSTPDVNLFDNDRYMFGAGLSSQLGQRGFLAFPLQLDLAYQYQYLVERDFTIVNTRSDSADQVVVTTGGFFNIFSASATLKF